MRNNQSSTESVQAAEGAMYEAGHLGAAGSEGDKF